MKINFKNIVTRLTEGHKILGLAFAAILYLICITGTLSVFYTDIERWEKPNLPEFTQTTPQAIAKAAIESQKIMQQDKKRDPLHTGLYISIPNEESPRLITVYEDYGARAYDELGNFAGNADHNLTHFLTELHYYLHLPESFGMILVSILGIFMLALLIGGALSHKRMFRDAFTLREREKGHLHKSDLHNRIGTWTLPFTIMVTATGSFVGFSQIVVFLAATFFHHGDIGKAMAPMFGSPQEISMISGNTAFLGENAIIRAFDQVKAKYPNETPTYLTIGDATTDKPYIEIMTKVPERLVYGESYRFDQFGNLKTSVGLKDGSSGKITYASLFPLHFGSFGGYLVKLIYFCLGLTLCIMINAGMVIWFSKSAAKHNQRPILHASWVSFVYGSVIAIFIAMTSGLLLQNSEKSTYWLSLIAIIIIGNIFAAIYKTNIAVISNLLRGLLGISILILALTHQTLFNSNAMISQIPNLILALTGFSFIATSIYFHKKSYVKYSKINC